MANTREATKRMRIQKLRMILDKVKKEEVVIDKTKLIAMMMIEYGVSKKTATEEFEAVMIYDDYKLPEGESEGISDKETA